MSKLNRIQSAIKMLDGGSFQKLSDEYLYRKRKWENIVSLGSMEGTNKTTKGTPDTYVLDKISKKYILVMYGTRADATSKLISDIEDAIKKSKIDEKDIQEIICCHTSSNVPVDKDNELRRLAGDISLTLIGIDTLANDLLQFKYQDIAKEHLQILESTEQVANLEQFISLHDKSKTNAPLSIAYIDETTVVEETLEKINDTQILLISGKPGIGKTRLAVEICKNLPLDSNVLCVKSNNMPVYQDIKDALEYERMNYLLLDDANTITNFEAVVNLLRLEELQQKLKIIMTIRDYALSEIMPMIQAFEFELKKIEQMTEDQIDLLVKSIFSPSQQHLERIKENSHGNPRIAVLASHIVKEGKSDQMDNGKGIMDTYYGQIIQENQLTSNEIIILFILSFKQKINLTKSDSWTDLLSFFKINFDDFNEGVKQLNNKELCDIYQDKAVKISDQSLADYIILDSIRLNIRFKLRDFFERLFPKYSKEIVEMLIIANNFLNSNEWINSLSSEIKSIYEEIIEEHHKEEFLIQYAVLIPFEALSYVLDGINRSETSSYKISQDEFEKNINKQVHDPIIKILSTLSNSMQYIEASELLIRYFQKKQDLINEIYSVIKTCYNIESEQNNYLEKRFCMLEIFIKLENISETTALLIINIAEEYLKFNGDNVTFYNGKINYNHYRLVDGKYLISLHTKILKVLSKIYDYNYEEVNNIIDKLLYNYPVFEVKNGYLETITSDLLLIEDFFFPTLNKLTIRGEAIVNKLYSEFGSLSIKDKIFINYKPSNKQKIYNAFSDYKLEYLTENVEYYEIKKAKSNEVTKFFNNYSGQELFNTLSEYQQDELLNKSEIEESVYLYFLEQDSLKRKQAMYSMLTSEFMIANIHFDSFMKLLSFKDGKEILQSIEKEIDERWYLSNQLICEKVEQHNINELCYILENFKDFEKIKSFNILSFKKYIERNPTILSIFEMKYEKNKISVNFFIPNFIRTDMVGEIIDLVGIQKLEKMYIESLGKEKIDTSGELLKSLIKKADLNFLYIFLKKLHELRLKLTDLDYENKLSYIWESENVEGVIKKYFDFLIQEKRVIFVGVDPVLKKIFKNNLHRAKAFIEFEILNATSEYRLVNLFNLSFEIFDEETLLEFITLLKTKKISDDFFRKVHLTMRTTTWTGSRVPLLDKEIDFLNKVIEVFRGAEYLSHALNLNDQVNSLKKIKNNELLADYLD